MKPQLSLHFKECLFTGVILRLRTRKLCKALGHSNAGREHCKQGISEKHQIVVLIDQSGDYDFCRIVLCGQTGCNAFTCDVEPFPHTDKSSYIVTKAMFQIVQSLLSILRSRKWRVRHIGEQLIKFLATDDRSNISDSRFVENLNKCTEHGREHCDFKIQQASKDTRGLLASRDHFLMLLLSYSLRLVCNRCCPFRDGSCLPGDRSCFCCGLFGLQTHPHGDAGRDRSHPNRNPIRELPNLVREWTKKCHTSSMNRTCILP